MILTILFLSSLSSTNAMIACSPRHSLANDLKALSLKAIPVTLVGPPDRKTAEDFGKDNGNLKAAEVEQRYGGSGDLACDVPGRKIVKLAQAQVVLKNDIIVTSGHALQASKKPCVEIPPEKCQFIIEIEGKRKSYQISSKEGSAYKCPHKMSTDSDWMVLKLKKPADSKVKPYGINGADDEMVGAFQDVINVAKSSDWPAGKNQMGLRDKPRHYGNCKTGIVDRFGSSGTVEMDCDVDHGASGGGVFSIGANPQLLAINQSVTEGVQPGCDSKIGTNGQDSYHPHCWANYATLVTGEFREMILKAAGMAPKIVTPPNEPSINRAPEGFKLPSIRIK